MMLICPYCGGENEVSENVAGGDIRCQACGQLLMVSPNKPPDAANRPTMAGADPISWSDGTHPKP